MLDVVFVAVTFALFALIGLIAKGVERLGPRTSGSDHREATGGEDRG